MAPSTASDGPIPEGVMLESKVVVFPAYDKPKGAIARLLRQGLGRDHAINKETSGVSNLEK